MTTLYHLGQRYFQEIIANLKVEGFPISPNLKFCASDGLLCYYDIASQTISLAMPDRDTNQGRLQMLLLRSLLDCTSNTEVVDFLRHILRWLIAHEIAHHCRHQFGVLSENIWQEEQIANYLAIAVSKPHFSVEDRLWCDAFLQRATQNLAKKQIKGSSAIDSYYSLPYSLLAANLIEVQTFEQIVKVKKQTGHLSETILKNNLVGNLPADIEQRVDNRHQIIKRINGGSYQNVFQHLYYYFGWMHIGLMSAENYTRQDFSRYFLNENHKYLFQHV